jgi:hypothetical protein
MEEELARLKGEEAPKKTDEAAPAQKAPSAAVKPGI